MGLGTLDPGNPVSFKFSFTCGSIQFCKPTLKLQEVVENIWHRVMQKQSISTFKIEGNPILSYDISHVFLIKAYDNAIENPKFVHGADLEAWNALMSDLRW